MITENDITEILYKTLTDKEKELVNVVSFCLISIGIKRKTNKISRDIIFAIKEYNKNKID
jgi:hypothetical protein